MYTNQISDIKDFARQIKRGTFGLYVATITEKKMNKYPVGTLRSQYATTPANPYLGEDGKSKVQTLTIYQNAATGLNYYNIVKAECKREGIVFTKAEFEAAFPKQETYCDAASDELANIILKHNEKEQEYLRLYMGRKPTKVLYYTIYNNLVVPEGSELMVDIMRYIPPKKSSAKQEALGLVGLVDVKQPMIENVVFMGQGDKFYCNPRFGFMAKFCLDNANKLFKK